MKIWLIYVLTGFFWKNVQTKWWPHRWIMELYRLTLWIFTKWSTQKHLYEFDSIQLDHRVLSTTRPYVILSHFSNLISSQRSSFFGCCVKRLILLWHTGIMHLLYRAMAIWVFKDLWRNVLTRKCKKWEVHILKHNFLMQTVRMGTRHLDGGRGETHLWNSSCCWCDEKFSREQFPGEYFPILTSFYFSC